MGMFMDAWVKNDTTAHVKLGGLAKVGCANNVQ